MTVTNTAGATPLTPNQVPGFWAAWGGWALDGMDSFVCSLVLVPALAEPLPRSGIPATAGNAGCYGMCDDGLRLLPFGEETKTHATRVARRESRSPSRRP